MKKIKAFEMDFPVPRTHCGFAALILMPEQEKRGFYFENIGYQRNIYFSSVV